MGRDSVVLEFSFGIVRFLYITLQRAVPLTEIGYEL